MHGESSVRSTTYQGPIVQGFRPDEGYGCHMYPVRPALVHDDSPSVGSYDQAGQGNLCERQGRAPNVNNEAPSSVYFSVVIFESLMRRARSLVHM